MLSANPTRVSQRAKKRGLPQVACSAPLAHSSAHKRLTTCATRHCSSYGRF